MMITHKPPLPNAASEAYLWYMRGAEDEAKARNDGLNTGAIEVIETMVAFAKLQGAEASRRNLIVSAAQIFCPHVLRWRFRHER